MLNNGVFGMQTSSDWTTVDVSKDGDGNGEAQRATGHASETDGLTGAEVSKWSRAVATKKGQWLKVDIPKGSRRVEMWGAVDIDHSSFLVEVDPAPYGGGGEFNGSAYNMWTTQNMTMYSSVLDPKTQYTIKVTNMDDTYLDISQFKFYEDKGGSGLSAGAIAGIAIGCAAGLALVGLLLWCLVRRRRRQKEEQRQLDVDNDNIVYRPVPQDVGVVSMASYQGSESHTATTAGLAGRGVLYPSASHSPGSSVSGPSAAALTTYPLSTSAPLVLHNPDSPLAAASADAAGASYFPTKGVPRGAREPHYHHMQHTDAGAAPGQGVIVTEAPPMYDPGWSWTSGSRAGSGPGSHSGSGVGSGPGSGHGSGAGSGSGSGAGSATATATAPATTPSDISGPIVRNASAERLMARRLP